ncbi:hypothetical protein Tco_0902144 [Tanacetum coccineum]
MKGQDNLLIPNPHPYLLNSIIKKPIIVLSSYQHKKKTHKPRKAIRTTEISQYSGPINHVADETVYKEWEDKMEMAATTTSSLDVEQDSANQEEGEDIDIPIDSQQTPITTQPSTSKPQKKQSRRKQKKNTEVPHPSDSLLMYQMKNMYLLIPMIHCSVVGVTRRVESSDDESLGAQEDASKQGRSRIEVIDRDAKVTLVETQRRNDENDDNLIFDIGVFDGDEIVVKTEEPVINVALTTKSIQVSSDEIDLAQEITLAQALAAMKSAKLKEKDVVQESSENVSTATTMVCTATTTVVATPAITTSPQQRAKGIAFREPVESTVTTTVPSQKSKHKGKAIMIEPEKPLKKKDQIELDEELAREIEAEEQAELERIQKERAAQEEASRAAIYEE